MVVTVAPGGIAFSQQPHISIQNMVKMGAAISSKSYLLHKK